MAFADGELSPEEMTRTAAIVETRPDLRAAVERQQALR
ncbi:MAG: anti-sigma factor, partial [Alphaproteobacteria bacterium]|nr:anti-sigma factor [Alphaproteobacteria bacterium]